MKISEQPDPPRLCIQGEKNSLNQADKIVKDIGNGNSLHEIDFAKGYECGDLHIVVNASASDEPATLELLFEAIPRGLIEQTETALRNSEDFSQSSNRPNLNEHLVLVGVTRLVQGPQNVIPSSVWLVRAKERVEFFRDILGPSLDLIVQVRRSLGERECRVLRVSPSGRDSQRVPNVVQGEPKVVHSICGNIGKRSDWHRIDNLDFQKFLARVIRVRLEKSFARVSIPEYSDLPLKIHSVKLCSKDLAA
jgi:hypothetical protein